jgi:hypothetical protein
MSIEHRLVTENRKASPNIYLNDSYSERSACMGSTEAARRAGM